MMVANGVMAVLVCLFATIGLCACAYWIGKAISRTKKDDGGLVEESQPDRERYSIEVGTLTRLHTDLEPFIAELGLCNAFPLIHTTDYRGRSTYIRRLIGQAIEKGVEYKRKYETLQKSEDLKLRKYCIEQVEGVTRHRIECGQELYEYLKTGNLPEKEKNDYPEQ